MGLEVKKESEQIGEVKRVIPIEGLPSSDEKIPTSVQRGNDAQAEMDALINDMASEEPPQEEKQEKKEKKPPVKRNQKKNTRKSKPKRKTVPAKPKEELEENPVEVAIKNRRKQRGAKKPLTIPPKEHNIKKKQEPEITEADISSFIDDLTAMGREELIDPSIEPESIGLDSVQSETITAVNTESEFGGGHIEVPLDSTRGRSILSQIAEKTYALVDLSSHFGKLNRQMITDIADEAKVIYTRGFVSGKGKTLFKHDFLAVNEEDRPFWVFSVREHGEFTKIFLSPVKAD